MGSRFTFRDLGEKQMFYVGMLISGLFLFHPIWSSSSRPGLNSASTFLHKNKFFFVGYPGCLSSWN